MKLFHVNDDTWNRCKMTVKQAVNHFHRKKIQYIHMQNTTKYSIASFKNTETSGVYCMNPHKELLIHIKDTVIQYPYIVPVSSHIPTYVPPMIPNT